MRKYIKTIVRSLPGGNTLIDTLRDLKQARRPTPQIDVKSVFTGIYIDNGWRDSESRSGPGSTLQYTENIRKELPPLVSRLGIRLILDAPCGDYNWFKLVPRPTVSYLGGDIVESIVTRNQHDYGTQDTSFMLLDVMRDELPKRICGSAVIALSLLQHRHLPDH